jgi:hypothetical protein
MRFYILPGPFRLGFGITSDSVRREKDYTGAWGGIARFKYLFEGPAPHVKRLENIIKTMHREMLWKVDEWETEWLDNNWTPEQLREFVLEIVNERHLQIKEVIIE